jgi:hypothetical protein
MSALLLYHCHSEVGVFVGDPIDELAHIRIFEQSFGIHAVALQFRIGEMRYCGLMTDRVHRHNIASTSAFGDGMMPDNGLANWSAS